jgi:hypothetical protein
VLIAALSLVPATWAAAAGPPEEIQLSTAQLERARAAATKLGPAAATRYAWSLPVSADAASRGRWQTLPDGRQRWTLNVHSPGARSLELALARVFLPHGATLRWRSADGEQSHGPWHAADVAAGGRFATPLVQGERARLEAIVPAAQRAGFALEVERVLHGYRDPFATPKSAGCHVDVACAQGPEATEQARSVARYTVGGSACTGQLLTDTARDGRLYFATAAHCVDSDAEAQSIVLYWRYESATCRAPGSAENAVPEPLSNAIVQTGGASLRATYALSDTSLLELNAPIPAGVEPYFSGWDRRPIAPTGAFAIHHAGGDEKRISVENGALTSINKPVLETPGVFGSRLLRVNDWDAGSMQPGSDGGGLFSPERRFIGQYSGGPAVCGNNLESYFGRFASAWEGGGTAATRMRDWLDPVGNNPEFFDGQPTGCVAAGATLDASVDPAPAGAAVTFTLALSGGVPPFTVEWDVDGDGTFDRVTDNVSGASATLVANYPSAQGVVVAARATDASACAVVASRALSVTGPAIEVEPSAPVQVCGDDDEFVEPGERWRIPTTFRNAGSGTLGEGVATLSKRGSESVETPIGPDTYGNRLGDDSNGCAYRFVDLNGLVAEQTLVVDPDSQSFPEDEGIGDIISVTPFDYYGSTVDTMVMSTNGYLSTSAAEQGGDYSNQCGPVPGENGSVGARMNVFWDDLQLRPVGSGSGLRHLRFDTCPRRAESSATALACHVFQWTNVGLFTGEPEPDGSFDFQAIVYPATGQIVYQYRRSPPGEGVDASVSFRNADASDGLEYSCFTGGSVVDGRSVCFFNPQFPPQTAAVPALRLETPTVAISDLLPGASVTRDVNFAVAPGAACGTGFDLTYAGTVDRNAHSVAPVDLLSSTVGGGSPCQTISGCAAQPPARIVPRDGLYANPNRFGNGVGAFNIPLGPRTIFFGAWFTGRVDRSPTWLILQGPIADNQAVMPVLRFRQVLDAGSFTVESNVVGQAVLTYLSPTEYALVWDVDGVAAGERQSRLYATTAITPNRTGAWYYADESGWGQVLDDHVLGAGTEQVIINYLYDAGGEPVWTLGGGALTGGTMPQNTFQVHCLYCAVLPDFGVTSAAAGSLNRAYQTVTTGTLSTAIVYPPPLFGEWTRNNVPIQMLTTPQPQQ